MISDALAVLENIGQQNELSRFYDKNKARLYEIAYKHLHNKEEAEDAVQEAFLRIADKPDKFFSLSGSNRVYYICAVVRNVSVDIFNKKNKIKASGITEDSAFEDDVSPIENSLFDKVSRDEILLFIDNLPPLQRNVLILTCLSELSISETAQTLNISKTVVNQRLYLARKSIKNFIEERRKCNE